MASRFSFAAVLVRDPLGARVVEVEHGGDRVHPKAVDVVVSSQNSAEDSRKFFTSLRL